MLIHTTNRRVSRLKLRSTPRTSEWKIEMRNTIGRTHVNYFNTSTSLGLGKLNHHYSPAYAKYHKVLTRQHLFSEPLVQMDFLFRWIHFFKRSLDPVDLFLSTCLPASINFLIQCFNWSPDKCLQILKNKKKNSVAVVILIKLDQGFSFGSLHSLHYMEDIAWFEIGLSQILHFGVLSWGETVFFNTRSGIFGSGMGDSWGCPCVFCLPSFHQKKEKISDPLMIDIIPRELNFSENNTHLSVCSDRKKQKKKKKSHPCSQENPLIEERISSSDWNIDCNGTVFFFEIFNLLFFLFFLIFISGWGFCRLGFGGREGLSEVEVYFGWVWWGIWGILGDLVKLRGMSGEWLLVVLVHLGAGVETQFQCGTPGGLGRVMVPQTLIKTHNLMRKPPPVWGRGLVAQPNIMQEVLDLNWGCGPFDPGPTTMAAFVVPKPTRTSRVMSCGLCNQNGWVACQTPLFFVPQESHIERYFPMDVIFLFPYFTYPRMAILTIPPLVNTVICIYSYAHNTSAAPLLHQLWTPWLLIRLAPETKSPSTPAPFLRCISSAAYKSLILPPLIQEKDNLLSLKIPENTFLCLLCPTFFLRVPCSQQKLLLRPAAIALPTKTPRHIIHSASAVFPDFQTFDVKKEVCKNDIDFLLNKVKRKKNRNLSSHCQVLPTMELLVAQYEINQFENLEV
ncbi:hypothetical protein VP01_1702g2 [Puccinia sorghi]|uniref:Uncharacterized protein n=1 Tax=Puccinia sorghi TaxID=27349 RepID=A0A0L6VHH4_9BASI|nr:hypothetical protein VP01_1702g2 [Puccinia sorghi]